MIPLTDPATMRRADEATIASGITGKCLMGRAARGLFDSHTYFGKTAIVCGSGNNAGDGYALASLLQEHGHDVTLVLLSDQFSPDGQYYFDICRTFGVPVVSYNEELSFAGYDTIVDCIYGTGFRGSITGLAASAIQKINESAAFVISADINSGLDGENGQSEVCVHSDLTVSIGSPKTGLYLGISSDVIKSVKNIDIGIKIPKYTVFLTEAKDFTDIFCKRARASHKGTFGYVTVMGGSPEYAGACKLANLSASALRSGCGVAQLAVPKSIANSVSPYLLESTLCTIPDDEEGHMCFSKEHLDLILSRMSAIAVGMGWGSGREYEQILSYLLEHAECPLIIDADGLNTLSKMDLSILKRTQTKVVLTPHLKEFERLSGLSVLDILKNPITHAMCFAKEYRVCLLLKGSTTIVTDGEIALLVTRGCAGMATAGSGDVLSGILAGIHGYCEVSPLSVSAGAFLAGCAGELAEEHIGQISMIASDTVAHIPCAIRKITELSK